MLFGEETETKKNARANLARAFLLGGAACLEGAEVRPDEARH
jgi:hypothetical protein